MAQTMDSNGENRQKPVDRCSAEDRGISTNTALVRPAFPWSGAELRNPTSNAAERPPADQAYRGSLNAGFFVQNGLRQFRVLSGWPGA